MCRLRLDRIDGCRARFSGSVVLRIGEACVRMIVRLSFGFWLFAGCCCGLRLVLFIRVSFDFFCVQVFIGEG